MTTSVTIDGDFEGKPIDELARLVALREKFLGETTAKAVTATAINILSSIRARTKKANPDKAAQFGVKVFPAPGVTSGFKSNRGSNAGKRVVREVGGHEMVGAKVINLAGKYIRGEQVLCFIVIIKSPKVMNRIKGGYERYYIVARNAADVKRWGENLVRKYVKRYSGMAKWILGQAQSQISQDGFSMEIENAAKKTAIKNLVVNSTRDGFSNGHLSIYVNDRLGYATLSLEGGSADVDLAIMKAANRTAGIINRLAEYKLDDPIPTPFPEVKR